MDIISYDTLFLKLNVKFKDVWDRKGESKKSVISGAWCKSFFVHLSCVVIFQYFLKNLIFLVLQWHQKNPQTFFSLKIKSLGKQKFVYKLFLSIESQKIRKIVIRKFAIFSPLLIFKEKLIFNGSSGFNWTTYSFIFSIY